MARPKVLPVLDEDLDEFCLFLQQQFAAKRGVKQWRAAFEHDWYPSQQSLLPSL